MRFVLGLFMSCGQWFAELVMILILCSALEIPFTLQQALFVLVVLNLGLSVPVTIANLGTFEAAFVFGLSRFGVSIPESLAIAGVHHFLQILAVALWSLAFVGCDWFNKSKRREIQ